MTSSVAGSRSQHSLELLFTFDFSRFGSEVVERVATLQKLCDTPGCFDHVRNKLRNEHRLTHDEIEEAMFGAMAFFITALVPRAALAKLVTPKLLGSPSPSRLADKVWHEMILDTVPYAGFCQEVFGHFLHHRPFKEGEEEKARQASQITKAVMTAIFGVEIFELLYKNGSAAGCMETCGRPGCDWWAKATDVAAECCNDCDNDCEDRKNDAGECNVCKGCGHCV